jgi:hypothetical protein
MKAAENENNFDLLFAEEIRVDRSSCFKLHAAEFTKQTR